MLRQIQRIVLGSLAVLLIAGLLNGAIREGDILGLLIVACLLAMFVPRSWKPFVGLIGTLLGIAVLGCFFYSLPSLARNERSLALALFLLSLAAYLFWKFRHPKVERCQRIKGAERTPILPPGETGA